MQIMEKVSMINLIGTQEIIRVNWNTKMKDQREMKKKEKIITYTDKCHFFLIFFIPALTLFHVQSHL